MSDASTNAFRDSLIKSAPQFESTIRTRDQVIENWCKDHGTTKDELSIDQIIEIRSLPEWINAS